jgi:hypothetical protein
MRIPALIAGMSSPNNPNKERVTMCDFCGVDSMECPENMELGFREIVVDQGVLRKGTIVKIHGEPLELMEDVKVYQKGGFKITRASIKDYVPEEDK